MNLIKKELVEKAKEQYEEIYPCNDVESLSDCFTVIDDELFFWFNTKDCSTHVLSSEVS